MNNEITCAVVKDLLPNYIDKLTSDETNRKMEAHFQSCEACTKERDDMLKEIETETAPDVKDFKKFMTKTKLFYVLKGVFYALFGISVLTCFIVDIAANRRLTWSLIVDAALIFVFIPAFTAIYSKTHKLIKAAAACSFLLLPMLYVFALVIQANEYAPQSDGWFLHYAIPISLIWIIILWIFILIAAFTKINFWNATGILLLTVIFGSAATDAIADQESILLLYTTGLEWIDSVSYLACAIICFLIGRKKSKNKE